MTSGRVQNCNLCVQEERFRRLSFEKSVFWFHSRTLSKVYVITLARCFRQIFQNWILCVQKNKLRKKLSYGKFRYHSFLPDFERWLSVTFGKKKFRGDCQKYLLRVPRNFLEKTTLWKLSNRWLNLEFERKPCGTIFKLLLRVQWNSVKSCTLWEKSKTLSFPHNMWNFIATSSDIGWIVKLAFIISSGTLSGQSSLNENVFRFSLSLDFEQRTQGRVVTSAS